MPSRTPTRRALLLGGTGALALAAGCVSNLESESDDEPETDGAGGDGTDGENGSDGDDESTTDTDTDTDADGTLEYDVQHFRHPETPAEPDASVLLERESTDDWLAERGLEADEAVDAFVADTDFADASLIALEADAPNHCYEMVLEDVAFAADEDADAGGGDGDGDGTADGTLELGASVRDESAENEMCAEARTAVGVLVRASVAGEPVAEFSARIVDDDGSEHGIGVDTASETDSGSAPDDEDDADDA